MVLPTPDLEQGILTEDAQPSGNEKTRVVFLRRGHFCGVEK